MHPVRPPTSIAATRPPVATQRAIAITLTALALLLALAACNRDKAIDDVATAPDDATAEALRDVAVATSEALAGEEGAAAPTNALSEGGAAPKVAPYNLSGAESEPEAVRAAELGGLDKPLFIWFLGANCDACPGIEDDVASIRDTWSDRVGFVTIDVDDPAAADVVRRLNVASAPTFVVLYTSGSPAATFTEWPGTDAFSSYLEQVLQLDAGSDASRQD